MNTRNNYFQHSPEAAKSLMALSKSIHDSGLSQTLIDLVNIRASQLNGCLFCGDMHSKEAKIHGERELRLYHLPFWRESSLFTAQEKAALEWTELLTKFTVHGAEDSDFQKVREHFSDKELADLTLAIATINAWNRLGIAFRPEHGGMDQMMGLSKAGLK